MPCSMGQRNDWGAASIVLQLVLVALMIAFPEMVTYWLDKPVTVDPAALERQLNSMPGLGNMPGLELNGLTSPTP